MKVLVFDTETVGLPLWDQPSDDPRQPRVCELVAELFDDTTGDVLAGLHAIILPEGWEIPDEMADIHGISQALAMQAGLPMRVVLPAFMAMWERCDIRVAHNEPFDRRMMRIELMKVAPYTEADADRWKAGAAFCTQAKSTPIVNRERPGRGKTASLAEAYEHFTGKKLENAHTALADVAACKAVYLALKEQLA